MNLLTRYTRWLHTRWPAGRVEVLPVVDDGGGTNVAGLYVIGDLAGVPLLKLSVNAGVRVARRVAAELGGRPGNANQQVLDLAIIGGGAAGFAAAKEAQALGLHCLLIEASQPFATIADFPKAKPIYTYPAGLALEGGLTFHAKSRVKEGLLEDLREQTVEQGLRWALGRVSHVEKDGRSFQVVLADKLTESEAGTSGDAAWAVGRQRIKARRVVVAIGRSGHYRKLDVPGQELDHKVFNRLHDPKDYDGRDVLVVGGGDSAAEAAIALTKSGANVTLSYRRGALSRPKPVNRQMLLALARNPEAEAHVESASDVRQSSSLEMGMQAAQAPGRLELLLGCEVGAIHEGAVDLVLADGGRRTLENDAVFAMIGRDPPLDLFRRSGVQLRGQRNATWWVTLIGFLALCLWLYHWKKPDAWIAGFPPFSWLANLGVWWRDRGWLPYNLPEAWASLGGAFSNPANLLGTLKGSVGEPGFHYTVAYCACVVIFGVRRIRRRRTPYVTWQTLVLMAIQCLPLFVLPYVLLPWAGHNGWFDGGWSKAAADALFPPVDYGHGREYWRAFGLILAWPLFIFNVFTDQPLWAWLAISVVQTFVFIPLIIFFWGKGAYCGWICSCGALAETLGDTQRHKMPHGPFWNRLNMLGQVFLVFAVVLLGLRVTGWAMGPESWAARGFDYGLNRMPLVNYAWMVDLLWASVLGVGLYFHFSGRVWCRFACPLAALMHIYTRFSRFRILADKKRCISCNVCTSVCHQGIDVMSFANKGQPMADPQCVRCSACVQSCPTGVLSFGQVDRAGHEISRDPLWLAASPVLIAEHQITVNGKRQR